MIKAIIFDCFGVLSINLNLWSEFVNSLTEDQKLPARDLNRAHDAGFITEQEFINQIKQLTGKVPDEVEKLSSNTRELTKNKELLAFIRILKDQYKIGLLSNISSNWIRDSFLDRQEQMLFDQMVFSYEVRKIKPDPELFELICERLGVQADEAVLIDDGKDNCKGAEKFGMHAIQYLDYQQFKAELEQLLNHV